MSVQVIRAGRALTPLEDIRGAVIVIEDGRIVAVGASDRTAVPKNAKEIDATNSIAVPGFVDVHIHGAGGRDVMEATPEALEVVTATVARHGTTALVATTVSAPPELTCRSLEGISHYIQSPANRAPSAAPRAEILGIHLEGPFIHPVRRGVHPLESLAAPSLPMLERFLRAAHGCAMILTIAPELPKAMELIDAARTAGLTVALGHTDATYDEARAAIDRGAGHAVHVFNAMRPFYHRETGVLGAVLTDPRVTAEIIADGVHVDAPAIRLLLEAKGVPDVILVSDGTAATGMPDGTYKLGSFEFTVTGGVCRNSEGRLAGSTLTLDRAVGFLVSLGTPLEDAVRMATLNPAKRLGLAGKKGVLALGADADVVLLTPELEVAGVMTRGAGLA